MSPRVVVADYGMGNLRSIRRALERAGAIAEVSDDAAVLERADRVVIPGQGAFGQAMERLTAKGLVETLSARAKARRPLLGVCLGLQLLFEGSDEAPGVAGLGAIAGQVELLPLSPGIKRPHMGWSCIATSSTHPVLDANGEAFYFVHSFAALHAPGFEIATARQGIDFVAAVADGPLVATQFHPEKSQDAGERLLRAWLLL